jgi:hypothetical protein
MLAALVGPDLNEKSLLLPVLVVRRPVVAVREITQSQRLRRTK